MLGQVGTAHATSYRPFGHERWHNYGHSLVATINDTAGYTFFRWRVNGTGLFGIWWTVRVTNASGILTSTTTANISGLSSRHRVRRPSPSIVQLVTSQIVNWSSSGQLTGTRSLRPLPRLRLCQRITSPSNARSASPAKVVNLNLTSTSFTITAAWDESHQCRSVHCPMVYH